MFGLLGLLLAFTFSGAAERFDARRALIVEVDNDIGTAYLRLDSLPPEAQPELRDLFRQYVDARLAFYRKILYPEAAQAEMARVNQLQNEIWVRAVTASQKTGTTTAGMLLSGRETSCARGIVTIGSPDGIEAEVLRERFEQRRATHGHWFKRVTPQLTFGYPCMRSRLTTDGPGMPRVGRGRALS